MTALCAAGGPSQVKASVAANLVYAAGGAAILSEFPALSWLVGAAAVLGVLNYETGPLCSTDPPAMPTFTAGDYLALLLADPGPAGHTARQKVSDTVANLSWFQVCECVSGAQPTAPTAPAAPGGSFYAPPPAVQNGPCLSELYAPNGTLSTFPFAGPEFTLPPGATSFTTTAWVSRIDPGCNGIHPAWNIFVYDNTHTLIHTYFDSVDPIHTIGNKYVHGPFTFTAGAFSVQVSIGSTPSCPTELVTLQFDVNCGSSSSAFGQPCQPDPVSVALLNQILTAVTLIQRQSVPFAYVAGPVHAGLSGQGTLAVSGLIGAKIEVTTLPPSLGLIPSTPDEHFDIGFVTWGTADGAPMSVRVEHIPQLSLPGRAGAFTTLQYSLHPGVVATITELVREP